MYTGNAATFDLQEATSTTGSLHLLLTTFRVSEDIFQVTLFKEANFALVKVYRHNSYHMLYIVL